MAREDVVGILLAGGRARRMGGVEKAFLPLADKSLIARCAARASPQVGILLIGAGGDPMRFSDLDCPVVADAVPDFAGPLAGILAGLEWATANRPNARWLASFACDTPFFPTDLVEHLTSATETKKASIAVAASGGRTHPVFALWNVTIAAPARQLILGGLHKVDALMARFVNATVEFSSAGYDPFFNINTPADLEQAEELLRKAR